jgi:hypothetical protein
MSSSFQRIARARTRQHVAAEVLALCKRLRGRMFDRGAALEVHDMHARHSRQLGRHDDAERAEERFDRELNRVTLRHRDRDRT